VKKNMIPQDVALDRLNECLSAAFKTLEKIGSAVTDKSLAGA